MNAPAQQLSRAWYQASFDAFVSSSPEEIIGHLTLNGGVNVDLEQTRAWKEQVVYLKQWLSGRQGILYLEFTIPRMGRRVDAILLVDATVFVVEFKVGAKTFERSAIEQVWDYALDLKNFHETSHASFLLPVLISTEAKRSQSLTVQYADDQVAAPICLCPDDVPSFLSAAVETTPGSRINPAVWYTGSYRPTPTIVEAARALYAQHSVDSIARNDAGAKNLGVTTLRIEHLIDRAKIDGRKAICFVTGVPGAGKTLVGLNIATRRDSKEDPTHAVFLSGNGPLVAVLREALARDELKRLRAGKKKKVTKKAVAESIKAFIQNVHHFRDEALREEKPPVDRVVIFDEAQRAWNRDQTARFMKRKRQRPNFPWSEPEFLLKYVDRHPDWAVVICLVGGGQEINTGESGIGEWLSACEKHFPHWELHISPNLTDSEYAAGKAIEVVRHRGNAAFNQDLHLAVPMRSFRAENVSAFVKALLDCEISGARDSLRKVIDKFPIAMTRDVSCAKKWLRQKARGTERCGMVASSKAMRLKPHALDIRVEVNPIHWFLNDRTDTRSSDFLEDCATEFQVQGLELDWVCVNWDGDLRYADKSWTYHDFVGSKWTNVKQDERKEYLKNAYRVLLTRARQGMVLFVPPGDPSDPTRPPKYYDATYQYLRELGIPEIG